MPIIFNLVEMKKILFLLAILLTSIACRKEDAPVYPKQIGKINPPAWFQGEWVAVDGASGIGLVVSADNIIKDGIDQKQVIEGQEIIFEDVYKYSQDQYVYTYELKQPIEIKVTYNVSNHTTIYTEKGTIAKDNKGNDRFNKETTEKTEVYSGKFFKCYYNNQKNIVTYTGILVDASLSEKNVSIVKNKILSKNEREFTENYVSGGYTFQEKLKEVTISEIENVRIESKNISADDFIKLVEPQKYKKK